MDSWIEGPFPPYTWNCFGRVENCTHNAQEAFNGILNRLVKVRNVEKPSKLLLLSGLHKSLQPCSRAARK